VGRRPRAHYLIVDITPDRLQADFFGYPEFGKWVPERPANGEQWIKGFVTTHGDNHLVEADEPAPPKA